MYISIFFLISCIWNICISTSFEIKSLVIIYFGVLPPISMICGYVVGNVILNNFFCVHIYKPHWILVSEIITKTVLPCASARGDCLSDASVNIAVNEST